jgi:hypothetical protein
MRCDECNMMFVLMETDDVGAYDAALTDHLAMHAALLRATRSEAEGR